MPQWQGRSKTNTAGYKVFVLLIRFFGRAPGYFLLRFVALYFFLFSWKSSRAILYFYRKRLGFSPIASFGKLYSNYYVFGQTLIDKFIILSGLPIKYTFHFDGVHHLIEIVSRGKGGLLLSGHAGNWEVAGQMLQDLNTTVNIVMFDGEKQEVKQYLESISDKKTYKIIYVRNDLSHIFKISAALAENEIVCMHADRFIRENKTLQATFLGEQANFPEGPFLMALKLNVPVVYVYAFKETASHYHLYSTPIKTFSQKTGDTTQSILLDFVNSLEQMVRKYPEQWFNYYNFWQK